jgi:hypothetical protein
MLVFICPSCGRFGLIQTPEKAIEAACPYCGNTDLDWLSRPDLEKPKRVVGEVEGGFALGMLRSIESLAMHALNQAYDVYDSTSDSKATKDAALKEFESVLYNLSDSFAE